MEKEKIFEYKVMNNKNDSKDMNENDAVDPVSLSEYPPLTEEDCQKIGFLRAAEAAELSHDLTPCLADINKRIRDAAAAGMSAITWYAPVLSNVPRAALASICYTLHLLGYGTGYVYTLEKTCPVGIEIYW